MAMRVSPDSALIEPGDSISLIARIIDDTVGVRPEYNQYFTWSLIGDTNAGFLKTSHGATNTFYSKDSLLSPATLNIVVHFDDSVTTQYPVIYKYDTVNVIIRPQPNAIKNQRNNNRPLAPFVSYNEELTLYSLTGKRVRPLHGLSANRVFNGSEAGIAGGVYFIVDKNNSNVVVKKIHYQGK
jgi:hypothetical protein